MGWYRFDCGSCKEEFQSQNQLAYLKPCPRCTGKLTTNGHEYKKESKKLRYLDSLALQRSAREHAAETWAESAKKLELNQEALEKALEAAGVSRMDLKKDIKGGESKEDDPDWAPPPTYTIAQRLTTGTACRTCRQQYPNCPNDLLKSRSLNIESPAARDNQNKIMGGSAWKHVDPKGTPFSEDRFNSFEWCHLIAASLGGPTVKDNLVAASFACNTEMNVIERCLQGRTELRLVVRAHCARKDVAEMIEYQVVYKNQSSPFIRWIDGTNTAFTKHDLDQLETLVQKWLKDMNVPKRME
jgi:hypothetical protein